MISWALLIFKIFNVDYIYFAITNCKLNFDKQQM